MEELSNTNLEQEEEFLTLEQKVSLKKRVLIAFILMTVGQAFLILSIFSNLTIINGVPRFFRFFVSFQFITYPCFFIAFYFVRKEEKAFNNGLYVIGAFAICMLILNMSQSSSNPLYVSISGGLTWSCKILSCLIYLYYFHGCSKLLHRLGLVKGAKSSVVFYTVFLTLFVIECIISYLSSTNIIKYSPMASRIILYGDWALYFFMYVFVLVFIAKLQSYYHKMVFLGGKENE